MARHFTRIITTPASARSVRDWARPFISLLSDFGSRDPSGGIMRGVVLGIAPEALIVDISHDVDKYQVADGALLLWCALPYMPIGSHVAVVDPGVGTARYGVALETARGDYLVGPDNGLLIPAAARLGGVVRGHLLENPAYRLPVVSSSFHGRDLFAPAAAHLAMGVPLEALGSPISPRDLVTLDWPEPIIGDGSITTSVIYVDTFGNLKFGALGLDLDEALRTPAYGTRLQLMVKRGQATQPTSVTWTATFGDVAVGEPLLYADSYGRLCLGVNQGSVAERLDIQEGDELEIWLPSVKAVDTWRPSSSEEPGGGDDEVPGATAAAVPLPDDDAAPEVWPVGEGEVADQPVASPAEGPLPGVEPRAADPTLPVDDVSPEDLTADVPAADEDAAADEPAADGPNRDDPSAAEPPADAVSEAEDASSAERIARRRAERRRRAASRRRGALGEG